MTSLKIFAIMAVLAVTRMEVEGSTTVSVAASPASTKDSGKTDSLTDDGGNAATTSLTDGDTKPKHTTTNKLVTPNSKSENGSDPKPTVTPKPPKKPGEKKTPGDKSKSGVDIIKPIFFSMLALMLITLVINIAA